MSLAKDNIWKLLAPLVVIEAAHEKRENVSR